MDRHSLRLRLLLATAVGIFIFLLVAGTGFYLSFQRHAEQLARSELENDFRQLVTAIRVDSQSQPLPHPVLSDPRYQKPYSGLYWQIDEAEKPPVHSPSLFDVDLDEVNSAGHSVELITGPNKAPLFAIERTIVLPLSDGSERHLKVTMAVDRADIDAAANAFRRDIYIALIWLMSALLVGSLFQITVGLQPLQDLQMAVQDIHNGKTNRLTGGFPSEVKPLVQDLNELLAARETAVEKARDRASNLAHGLKTPLTILNAVADDLEIDRNDLASSSIRENTMLINELVERELARARMSGGKAKSTTPLRATIARVINTVARTPRGAQVQWNNAVSHGSLSTMEAGDLTELLGNILENASKWARTTVNVSYADKVLCIEDDGSGVAEDKLHEIEQRGTRLDHSSPGHGLGLAIVRELVESYGLDVKYKRSSLGGLSVNIGNADALAKLV